LVNNIRSMRKEAEQKYGNIERNCDRCGVAYKAYRSKNAQCESRFCSHMCYGLHKRRPFYIKNGYKLVYKEGHPRADNRGRVRLHLLVMEEKIGRPVLKTESVHHIDGNKLNNHPNNLEMFSSHREHLLHHWRENTLRKTRNGSVLSSGSDTHVKN
jgi:hypothetical protein